MSAEQVMAIIFRLAQNMEEDLPRTNMPARVVLPPPYLRLSPLDVGHTVAGATPTVVAAAAVDFQTSAVGVAVSTTSCRRAQPMMMPY
jgi:hypothetical protein